jgi:Reverse transcriptase (RNA-dependent DNA polymerase)
MSSTINIANNINNHIWIASFDIAKAFDSVPLPSLKAAMERIKIPNKIINISLLLLHDRKLKINLNYDSTDELTINNGLDQGETLAPLWWTIFYDPLITKLYRHKKNIPFNVMAYIDDLALMNNNPSKLQKDINTFLNFLTMNNIKCNNEKTQIIFIGPNKHPSRNHTFSLNSSHINTLPYKDSLKYLGCYFSGKNSSKSTAEQFINKSTLIRKAILATNWNGPMAKQVAQWIIPSHLEYYLHISFFTLTDIKSTQRIINSICKTKFHLERTTPNSLINSPIGLNVINI